VWWPVEGRGPSSSAVVRRGRLDEAYGANIGDPLHLEMSDGDGREVLPALPFDA
jgi:hypothetical protein